MIFLFYVYLIFVFGFAFCNFNNIKMNITNPDEEFTLIDCKWQVLESLALPAEKLSLKSDIRFIQCRIPKDYSLFKLMKELGINVKKLTFDSFSCIVKNNVVGLQNLTYLSISQSTGWYWDPDLLTNLTNLEVLYMRNVSYHLPNNYFRFSNKLKSLEIHGQINNLRKGDLDGLTNLVYLKLESINIKSIDRDFNFDNLIYLKTLSISHKILNNLPLESFRNITNLENITIFCGNYNSDISNDYKFIILPNKLFTNLTSVKTLSLKSIESMELKEDVFADNFKMLEKLSISGCKRNTLPENIFNYTRNIKVLQITHNDLQYLPEKIIENMNKLEVLDLSCNKFNKMLRM